MRGLFLVSCSSCILLLSPPGFLRQEERTDNQPARRPRNPERNVSPLELFRPPYHKPVLSARAVHSPPGGPQMSTWPWSAARSG